MCVYLKFTAKCIIKNRKGKKIIECNEFSIIFEIICEHSVFDDGVVEILI